MALNIGGICVMSPSMAFAPATRSASVTCSHGALSSTSSQQSCDGVPSPSFIVPVYTLSMPVNESTIFVALPMQRMSKPVAFGSSVPQCPTFLLPILLDSHRVLPTTSKEVHPLGLSMRRTMFCHVSGVGGGLGGRRKCGGGRGGFSYFASFLGAASSPVASAAAGAPSSTAAEDASETRRTARGRAGYRARAGAARGRHARASIVDIIARVEEWVSLGALHHISIREVPMPNFFARGRGRTGEGVS